MNQHRCPSCRRGYWSPSEIGEITKIPKHTPSGKRVGKKAGAVVLCPGSDQLAETILPPRAVTNQVFVKGKAVNP